MRFAIFTLTLLLALVTVTTVQAQEPAGSISGRIIFEGPQPDYDEIGPNLDFFLFVIPANIPQPISLEDQVTLQHFAVAEADGSFIVDGLSDGDYYLFPIEQLVGGSPSPETITVARLPSDEPSSRPAVRVTVSDGGATTGVELRVRLPDPTPTPTPPPTGSISGRLTFVGAQPVRTGGIDFPFVLFLLPADIPQPIDSAIVGFSPLAIADAQGNFTFRGLEDGEYFIMSLGGNLEDGMPPPEPVELIGMQTRPGIRIVITEGQAVTGVEVIVRIPEATSAPGGGDCTQFSPPNGLSPPAGICPPATGAGGMTASAGGAVLAYLGLAVAGLAVAMFATGLALRVRRVAD